MPSNEASTAEAKRSASDDMRQRLADVLADAEKEFGEKNPGRLEQLRGALATADMAVEALHTEEPYVPTHG
jgi:hypothetical protein